MKNELIKGWKAAVPVALGYLPIGLAFGILAAQQGMTAADVFFMSLLVYAGSAQFIAAAMIASGAAAAAIIFTTFLVNLRHLLMSASLAPFLKHLSTPVLSLISLGITDETYAAGYPEASAGKVSARFYLGLNSLSQASWIASTVIGCLLGGGISSPEKWGLDFALPAMFIGLLFMQMKSRKDIIVALAGGSLSLAFTFLLKDNFNIIAATVAAAFVGVCLDDEA
ncbi:MAG: AzlC family ABC transporter permease [Caldicoprobacterales bacterium]|nr:AzlC family ABC transporter permease [Clostridiales bacterium]